MKSKTRDLALWGSMLIYHLKISLIFSLKYKFNIKKERQQPFFSAAEDLSFNKYLGL
jgi:hypothetical protein